MAVPVLIFIVCLGSGAYASSRWLPELAPGPFGDVGFFAVCGLLGSALAMFGLRVYILVENLSETGEGGPPAKAVFANGVTEILFDTGLLVSLALAVYLLSPRPSTSTAPASPDMPFKPDARAADLA